MRKMLVLSCIASAFLLSGCISLGKHSSYARANEGEGHYDQPCYDSEGSHRYERNRDGDYQRN
ncbi:hypothetical protein EGH55_20580 [Klebsiella aerogenes]|nr:hypothetical protein EGH55_20580 [Klebsiella aerogenes]